MRAVRCVGGDAAAVEGGGAADAITEAAGGVERQSAAHAVAGGADLRAGRHLRLLREEGEHRLGVAPRAVLGDRADQAEEALALVLVGEHRLHVERLERTGAVEGIGDDHDVAVVGELLAHLAHHRAEAAGVGIHDDGRPGAVTDVRCVQAGVHRPIGGLDGHVTLRHLRLLFGSGGFLVQRGWTGRHRRGRTHQAARPLNISQVSASAGRRRRSTVSSITARRRASSLDGSTG